MEVGVGEMATDNTEDTQVVLGWHGGGTGLHEILMLLQFSSK